MSYEVSCARCQNGTSFCRKPTASAVVQFYRSTETLRKWEVDRLQPKEQLRQLVARCDLSHTHR